MCSLVLNSRKEIAVIRLNNFRIFCSYDWEHVCGIEDNSPSIKTLPESEKLSAKEAKLGFR